MEIIKKVLMLVIIGVFSSAGAVLYFSDESIRPTNVADKDAIWDLDQYGRADAVSPDRLNVYKQTARIANTDTQTVLMKNSSESNVREVTSYSVNENAESLAKLYPINALEREANYWHDRYHSLNLDYKPEANNAYMKYQSYKTALDIKKRELSQP